MDCISNLSVNLLLQILGLRKNFETLDCSSFLEHPLCSKVTENFLFISGALHSVPQVGEKVLSSLGRQLRDPESD